MLVFTIFNQTLALGSVPDMNSWTQRAVPLLIILLDSPRPKVKAKPKPSHKGKQQPKAKAKPKHKAKIMPKMSKDQNQVIRSSKSSSSIHTNTIK